LQRIERSSFVNVPSNRFIFQHLLSCSTSIASPICGSSRS
jgi:hypothetical protein